jgi:hypothetical protein
VTGVPMRPPCEQRGEDFNNLLPGRLFNIAQWRVFLDSRNAAPKED